MGTKVAIKRFGKRYMNKKAHSNPEIRKTCKNQNGFCSIWATQGWCTQWNELMIRECAPACQFCEKEPASLGSEFGVPQEITIHGGPSGAYKS